MRIKNFLFFSFFSFGVKLLKGYLVMVKGSSRYIAQVPENVKLPKKGVPEIFSSTLKMKQLAETHLSNTMLTLSDLRNLSCSLGSVANHYEADIIMSVDYSSFGVSLEGRSWNPGAFRFGFSGMEKDNELKGEGNSYTTEFRQYDPRLGRWLSLDPLSRKFPWQSPYVAFDNNPIAFNDPDGREAKPVKQSNVNGGGEDPPFKAYKKDGRFFAGYKSTIDRKWENVGKTVNIMAQGPVGVVTSIVDDLSSRNYGSATKTVGMEGGQHFFESLGKAIKTDEVIGKNRKLLGTLFSVAPKKIIQGVSIALDTKNIIDEVYSSSSQIENYYELTVQFMKILFDVKVSNNPTSTLISVPDGSQGFDSEFTSAEQFENTLNTVFKVMKMVFPPGIWDLGDKSLFEQAKAYVSSFSFINDVKENTLNNQ